MTKVKRIHKKGKASTTSYQFSHPKPTPELLLQHESDIKITKKLFYEITGIIIIIVINFILMQDQKIH